MWSNALQIHIAEPRCRAAFLWRAVLPLALYAALAAVLAELFTAPIFAPALLGGAAILLALSLLPARIVRFAGPACVLGAALAAARLRAVRTGAMLLANRLYASSEAVNAYAYDYYAVAEEDSALYAALFAAAALGGALCALLYRRRAALVALLLGVAFLEAYFGVTPSAWRNLLLFAVLALLLLREDAASPNGAALLAGLAVIALAVFLLAPRPNAAAEAYSEHLRDELGIFAAGAAQSAPPPEAESAPVHQESRQHEEQADPNQEGERGVQEFERQTESEREISFRVGSITRGSHCCCWRWSRCWSCRFCRFCCWTARSAAPWNGARRSRTPTTPPRSARCLRTQCAGCAPAA